VALPAAGQTKVGTTAGQFLGISVGPRAMGMGGAYVASNEDVTSIYWNPGAFQQAGKSQLAFSNTDWLVGTKFRWVGLMLNIGSENAIGVSLTQLDYGEEEVTTVALPEGTGERWSAQDLSIGLSYCRRLTDRFSVGATVKYVDQRIWNESATAFAFDIGLLFVTGFQDMRLGVSMSNFGGEMKMDGRDLLQRVDIDPLNSGSNKALVGTLKTDPWAIPLLFRVGVAIDAYKDDMFKLTLAADALRPNDNEESVNAGGEVGWNNMVFLRGGYKSLFGKDAEEGMSMGAGLKYTAEGFGAIEVNYAFTKFGLFGNLNTIALAVSF
jgi:Type IX secretion system protein PorV